MENELYHHGVIGMKWGKHNGPPYPLDAAGKEQLRQQKREERAAKEAEKNESVGRERLENRIKRANASHKVDRLAAKIGDRNIQKAAAAHESVKSIKDVSNEILSDSKRTQALGRITRNTRVATIAGTAAGAAAITAGAAIIGANAVWTAPMGVALLAANGADIALGREIYKKTFY